ncbi:uncharacterized protein [Ptychodera flava]|uniref:uncharacterized protein n=1 Tax=Ptychodera flava TaxID=63121 RepID=UPI00396A7AC4
MLVPEQMRKQADTAGVPLKLIGTYDQAKFDELELIFIDRDGGGIQPVEAYGNAEEEDHVEDLQIYEPTVNLHGGEETTVVDTDMTYETGKNYTLLLEMEKTLKSAIS